MAILSPFPMCKIIYDMFLHFILLLLQVLQLNNLKDAPLI